MCVYSICFVCVSVIFGGGLLLSLFLVTFWCALIGGMVVSVVGFTLCDV